MSAEPTGFKGTPGPWEIFPSPRIASNGDCYGVQSRQGPVVANCGLCENQYSLANAVLCAASKDLLAALQGAPKLPSTDVDEIMEFRRAYKRWLEGTARAAIARAVEVGS